MSTKLFLVLPAIFLVTASADKCGNKPGSTTRFKAKLETKGICMNYTLRLLEGQIDTSLINANWKDEATGKSYKNVFGLANPCDFPASINQDDTFYFTIDTARSKNCAVCMAYYPTPPRKLNIKVLDK